MKRMSYAAPENLSRQVVVSSRKFKSLGKEQASQSNLSSRFATRRRQPSSGRCVADDITSSSSESKFVPARNSFSVAASPFSWRARPALCCWSIHRSKDEGDTRNRKSRSVVLPLPIPLCLCADLQLAT